MKKIIPLVLLALAGLAFWMLQKPKGKSELAQDEPRSEDVQAAMPRAASLPSTPQVIPSETPLPEPGEEKDWMKLTLQHQLTPDTLEAWAKKEGVPLRRETKGHPASGERLEMSWGQEPVTTAVFDILDERRYQLSAVRSLYPAGSELNELKVQMQHVLNRPIERENARTVVFRADEEGMIVWMAREDDGRLKLAFEYGAHTHAAP